MKLIGVSLVAMAFLLGSMAGYAAPLQEELSGARVWQGQEKTKAGGDSYTFEQSGRVADQYKPSARYVIRSDKAPPHQFKTMGK